MLHVGVKRDPTNFSTPAMRDTTHDFFSRPRRVSFVSVILKVSVPNLDDSCLILRSSHHSPAQRHPAALHAPCPRRPVAARRPGCPLFPEWPQWSACCLLDHSRSCPASRAPSASGTKTILTLPSLTPSWRTAKRRIACLRRPADLGSLATRTLDALSERMMVGLSPSTSLRGCPCPNSTGIL